MLNVFRSDALVALLRPEEVLDLVLHYVQSKDIKLVEWNILLHRRMNVPRIVSVTRLPLPFCPPQGPPSQAEHTFVESFFSCSRRRFRRACSLLEHLGLSPQTASKLSLETEGDMRAKGHFYRLKQSATTPVLDQHLVLYPLSFAAFRPCEILEQPAQYSKSAPLLAHPRAAPFGRVRLTDAHDAPLSDEFDHLVCDRLSSGWTWVSSCCIICWGTPSRRFRTRRTKTDASTLPWRRSKNGGCGRNGEGEEWMEDALSRLVCGSELEFPPECRASS